MRRFSSSLLLTIIISLAVFLSACGHRPIKRALPEVQTIQTSAASPGQRVTSEPLELSPEDTLKQCLDNLKPVA